MGASRSAGHSHQVVHGLALIMGSRYCSTTVIATGIAQVHNVVVHHVRDLQTVTIAIQLIKDSLKVPVQRPQQRP
jgi:hypothetical protein